MAKISLTILGQPEVIMDSTRSIDSPGPDDPLLRLFLTGDPAACRRVERWAWEIVAFRHYRIPVDEREDVIQETLSAVWRAASRGDFQLRVGLRSFVRKVASARCIDRLRRLRPTIEIKDSLSDDGPNPYEALLAKDRLDRVAWAIQNLGEECREIIEMHFFKGISYARIAEHRQRAEATMRVRMFNCLQTIRKLLERLERPPRS